MSDTLAIVLMMAVSLLVAGVGMRVTFVQTRAQQAEAWAQTRVDDERHRRHYEDSQWQCALLDVGPDYVDWLTAQRQLCEEGRRPLPPLPRMPPPRYADPKLMVTVLK